MADLNVDDLRIMELSEGRKNWHLCIKGEEEDVSDEVIVRIQGVLVKNNLVPKNNKAQFLTQAVEVVGLETETFGAALSAIPNIKIRFSEHLAGVDITNNIVSYGSVGEVFPASNRIFTPHQDVPTEQDNHFQEGINPLGYLASLKNRDLIHAPENIIKYYSRVYDSKSSEFAYASFVPGGFSVGDIVELQVSFIAMASGFNKVKITSRLQALTLLDNSYSKAAGKSQREAMMTTPSVPAIRRRVGYFQEDQEDERKHKKNKGNKEEGGDNAMMS
ncbi:hypothetical protein B0H13DRAFT_2393789 [Mycena leptocephala]|nr:hypothetical protein B0H13DRAFT_2393789 [Mycena leptocephala]